MHKTEAKIFKHGNSQAITLNQEALYRAGLTVGDALTCRIENEKLIFERKKVPSFKEQIQNFYRNGGSYAESEIWDDETAGNELW